MQRDPARAFFLCLLVLAQLMLPATFGWAVAARYGDNCVVLASGSDDGKAPWHDHGQQCAHCRPEALTLIQPLDTPRVAVAIVDLERAAHLEHAIVEVAMRALPPPRGPPILLRDV